MTYLDCFPNFDDVLPSIEGFSDSSWKNDSCPSLSKELDNGDSLIVYIDYKDKSLSDFWDLSETEYKRYSLSLYRDSGEYESLLLSNDLSEIEQYITNYK
jgi:hypothetical protein